MTARTLPGARGAALLLLPTLALLPLSARSQAAATPAWGTYLGGSATDTIGSVAQSPVDGSLAVVGSTQSQDFPPRTGTGTLAKRDAFVHLFSANGSHLTGRLLGGSSGEDLASGVAFGPDGSIFVVGLTETGTFPEFPAPPAALAYGGGPDAFLACFTSDGTPLWLVYLGGTGFDVATGVTVSGNGVYVTGYTNSPSFTGTATPGLGGTEGFVLRMDVSSNPPQLVWRSFVAGTGDDFPLAMALDGAGNVLITGYTTSAQIPSSLNSYHGGRDGLVAKLNANTGSLSWVSFLGDIGVDEGRGILPLPGDRIAVTGITDRGAASLNGFVTRLTGAGQELKTETFGGTADEDVTDITADTFGNLYIVGSTGSRDFPLRKHFDMSMESDLNPREGFVVMFPAAGSRQPGWASFLGGNGMDVVNSASMRAGSRLVLAGQTFSSAELFSTSPYDATLAGAPDGFILTLDATDISPPMVGSVYDRPQEDQVHTDVPTQTSTTSLAANWDPFIDEDSDTEEYECAFGTAPGLDDVSPFTPTSVPLKASCSAQGLTLDPGRTYYATARATNSMGVTAVASSDGVMIPGEPPADGGTDGGTNGGTDGGTNGGTDGGTDENPGGDDQPLLGWSCSASDAGVPVLLGLLGLALLMRRRGASSR